MPAEAALVETPPISGRRSKALDGIRALAIVGVILYHADWVFHDTSSVGRVVSQLFSFGWLGVDLFFVLSGFLITGILLDTREARNFFSVFYARRVLRIFPPYYLALALVFLFASAFPELQNLLPDHRLPYFLYVSNWTDPFVSPNHLHLVGHFWSLAIEEQFYLVWPIAVLIVPRERLWKVCSVGILLAVTSRFFFLALGAPADLIYKSLLTRMDALLFGGLTCLAVRDRVWSDRLRRAGGWAAALLFALAIFLLIVLGESRTSKDAAFTHTFGFSLFAASFAFFVGWVYLNEETSAPVVKLLGTRPFVFLGIYSYGIYLFHLPLYQVLAHVLHQRHWAPAQSTTAGLVYLASGFAFSYLLAKVSFEVYEKPFLTLKKYLRPVYASAVSAPVTAGNK